MVGACEQHARLHRLFRDLDDVRGDARSERDAWLIGEATQYWQFVVLGLFVGVAGGSFSVGTA
jgi:hypothetical protein